MSGYSLTHLTSRLTNRDYELLQSVVRYRLLTTKHLQRLHFDHQHPTAVAAARACNRALARLRDLGALKTLERRIGGARAGSAGLIWYLGPAGERVLNARDNRPERGRRNYREPSRHFVDHTLAIADIAAQVHDLARSNPNRFELLEIQTEPTNWQTSLTSFGTAQTLKPDLRIVTAAGDFEHHWFLEIDLATEHLPVVIRQCAAYETHQATGRYQAEHGLYPAVVWIVPTHKRRTAIQKRIQADPQLDHRLFTVVATEDVPRLLLTSTSGAAEGAAKETHEPTHQEGETHP